MPVLKASALVLLSMACLAPLGRAQEPSYPCLRAAGPVSIVSRPAEVVIGENERLRFQDEPRPCPTKGPCPWRRKAYVVNGDYVQEEAVSAGFSCVTYKRFESHEADRAIRVLVGTTDGWVPSDRLCVHPPLRKTRADPTPVLDAPGRKVCPPHFTRTVEDDQSFFTGTFSSSKSALTTRDYGGAELDLQLAVEAPTCRVTITGTAYQRGTRDVFNGGEGQTSCLVNITFNDSGAEINLSSCGDAACEGFSDQLRWLGPPTPTP